MCVTSERAIYAVATFDMNIHQLQMVADHLTSDECRRLAVLLSTTGWSGEDSEVVGENVPHIPCLDLLVAWDSKKGKELSFHNVAFRLEQIKRKDLAEALSEIVYHEKADTIQRTFLDDPFKKTDFGNDIDKEDKNARKAKATLNDIMDSEEKEDEDSYEATALALVLAAGSVAVCIAVVTVACRQRLETCVPCCWLIAAVHHTRDWCCTTVIGYHRYRAVDCDMYQV